MYDRKLINYAKDLAQEIRDPEKPLFLETKLREKEEELEKRETEDGLKRSVKTKEKRTMDSCKLLLISKEIKGKTVMKRYHY